MRSIRIVASGLVLAGMVALAGCETGEAKIVDTTETEVAPGIPVEVTLAQTGAVEAVYSGTATLLAEYEAPVVARAGGEITQILVEEGDTVKTGQIMARLDGDRLRLDVRQSRAQLQKVKQDYQRNVQLHEKGLVSADSFENLKYDVDALEASYRLRDLELSYTEIRAPIDGIITSRMIKTGNQINIGDRAFHITDLSELEAFLYVPQRELFKFQIGQKTRVLVDALPDQVYAAFVKRISPSVDPDTGTFRITLAIDDATGELKPGMFGRVQVVYAMHEGIIVVPENALVAEDSETAVFIVEDGIAHRQIVEVGVSNNGLVEITSGLEGNEKVIVVGHVGLREGTRVDEQTG